MDVFRRRELKFLLTSREQQILEDALHRHMIPDSHGKNTICNLYYDTPDHRLIRHSLEHPVYKEKLRLRCYGVATSESDIFLELKKKYKGVVYKRRVRVTEPEAVAFMNREGQLHNQGQISREIRYVRDYYQTLQPRMYISYDREAWYDPVDRGFRITLDRNVQFRTDHLNLTANASGRTILQPEQSLLEVKAEGAVPMWLVQLLAEEQIYKQSFSKYGRAYERMLKERLALERGEVLC